MRSVLAPYSGRQGPADWSDLPMLGGSWSRDVVNNLFVFVERRMSVGDGA